MSRSALTLLASLLAASTAYAQDMRTISGEAVYRERMALPDDAELVVDAKGFQDTILATSSTAVDGQQVPLPFTLDIPADVKASFQAAILIDDMPRFISEPVTIAAGKDDIDLGDVLLSGFSPSGFQSTFMCGDARLEVSFHDDEAIVESDQRIYYLSPVISADGAKYQSEDGDNVFWSKGNGALVTLDGKALPDCSLVPSEQSARWSGQGNEPGWRVIIADGRMSLNMNYGNDRLDLLLPEPKIADGAYRYEFAPFGLAVGIREAICQDDMSGRYFPETVTLETATTTLKGCGGDTLSLLTGAEWTVTAIDGEKLTGGEGPNFTVSDEGQIYGSTGCNRFTGMLSINGEGGIEIGPLATTRMACDATLMQYEQAFLSALGAADGFAFGPEGELRLTAGGNAVIQASRH